MDPKGLVGSYRAPQRPPVFIRETPLLHDPLKGKALFYAALLLCALAGYAIALFLM